MKNWFLFFALITALISASCSNKEQTFFEDTGKKMDQGIHDARKKINENMNRSHEKTKDTDPVILLYL